MKSKVLLKSLIVHEVGVILLRCMVGESEYKELATKLQLHNIKQPLLKFATAAEASESMIDDLLLSELEESIRHVIDISWGERLDYIYVPYGLDTAEKNLPPTSRIFIGLSFIISELLINVFRHQFGQIGSLQDKLPVRFTILMPKRDGHYDLEIRTSPSFKPKTTLGKASPTGLASLEFVANALNVEIPMMVVSAGGKEVRLPFPKFDSSSGELVNEINNIPKDSLVVEKS
jgi:hypothetical protein